MKFNHAVKHNGVLYPAGAEVPVGDTPKKEFKVEAKAPEKVETPEIKAQSQPKKKRK